MQPRRLALLQSRILDGAKAADPTLTDEALADAMACDRTLVSRYRHGERVMDVAELAGLLAGGADPVAVLGPLAGIVGASVVVEPAGDHVGSLARDASKLVTATALFSEAVGEAAADGRISDGEAVGLEQQHGQLTAQLRRLSLRIRAGRATG